MLLRLQDQKFQLPSSQCVVSLKEIIKCKNVKLSFMKRDNQGFYATVVSYEK